MIISPEDEGRKNKMHPFPLGGQKWYYLWLQGSLICAERLKHRRFRTYIFLKRLLFPNKTTITTTTTTTIVFLTIIFQNNSSETTS